MNAQEHIISRQTEWAKNKGLQLWGSCGDRGREDYTHTIEDNLFQPLNEKTRQELEKGDGGELSHAPDRPAKIQALHSSSALGINLFDYWRGFPDLSIITNACGLSRADPTLTGEVQFEQKFPIDDRFQFAPNLDVLIRIPQTGKDLVFAIECKFTEAYSLHNHGGMDRKYFEHEDIWQHLPETKRLAQEISPEDERFVYLHAAQLIKHILGLNRKFGHARFRLLYLWYDALGEPGSTHRKETEEFSAVVRADGVIFHETTYQDLIVLLARYRKDHSKYVRYLTERYL